MFVEKFNKKQDGVYTIEEEKVIVDGVWEGYLNHDNVNKNSIAIYTGINFTGEKVRNYNTSIDEEMPWKLYLKVFSTSAKIYIIYESKGDQIEAEDINLLQNAIKEHEENASPHTGHETIAGAQEKANTAELNAKSYTIQELNAITQSLKTYTDAKVAEINVAKGPFTCNDLKGV